MEKMMVVVFDNENKAYEGLHALKELDADGSVSVHADAVVQKNTDGKLSFKHAEDNFPVRTLGGTAVGSAIGLLGGPIGLGIGAVAGTLAGSLADLNYAGVNADFLDEVSGILAPGKYAVVADVSEEWVTPVDTRMEPLGGVVFRAARKNIEQDQRTRDEAELRAEIAALKIEHARARAERKAKLQAQIDELNARLEKKVEEQRAWSEQRRRETEAKLKALQEKAAKAQGDAKAAINTRITQLRGEYERSETKVRSATATGLRKAADKIEKTV
jgi:uncharacterized membrane protein